MRPPPIITSAHKICFHAPPSSHPHTGSAHTYSSMPLPCKAHNSSRRCDPTGLSTRAPAVALLTIPAVSPCRQPQLPPWRQPQLPPWRRAANHSSRRGANHNSRRGAVRPTTAPAETPKLQSRLGREVRDQTRSLAALAHGLAIPNGDLQRLTPRLPQIGRTCKAVRCGVLLPMHLRRQTQTTVGHGRSTQMRARPNPGPA